MRPIKFRAWDGEKFIEEYSPDDFVIGLDGGFWELENDGTWNKMHGNRSKNIVLMQFTGLLDKNGKEIYEGDVVKCGRSTAVVEWDEYIDQDFYWGNASGFKFNFDSDEMDGQRSYEVIGNIYENPELI